MPQDPRRQPDPMDRDVPPGSIPLRSPMPRSRALDGEEPELNTQENDVAPEAEPEGDERPERQPKGR